MKQNYYYYIILTACSLTVKMTEIQANKMFAVLYWLAFSVMYALDDESGYVEESVLSSI